MKLSRREFIKRSVPALGMSALATQFNHFGAMSAFAQKTARGLAPDSGYKALVCIFLDGGNDGNNTIIPNHNDSTLSNYSDYGSVRSSQGLAIAQNTLLPIAVPRMGNLSYGFHPRLGPVNGGLNNGIHELWAQGKMAIVGNVGTLVSPMTRVQYQDYAFPRPFQLFSHSDQVSQFHSGRSDTGAFTGWGGKISDRLSPSNNPNALIPMITSIDGAQLFTAGESTLSLAISGAEVPLNEVLKLESFDGSAYSILRLTLFNQMRTIDRDSHYVAAASAITEQAMQANNALSSYQEVNVIFPNTSLGNQLKQVARMIKKRGDLNISRQIFYCQLNGFDNHDSQLIAHADLLKEFSQATRAFYDETLAQGVSNQVTTFTMSDFNRTFNPSGFGGNVGSDHAWGNHMFVIGGSVAGGDFYGLNTSNGTPYPTLALDGPDDADIGVNARGRWIPTTSVEQYAATIARWYGLSVNDIPIVFPNIGNFSTSNLSFMQS